MSLQVYEGLPASGKTKAIISEMDRRRSLGDQVMLILSNEHEELTRRPNVREGGMMGCRDSTKKFQIERVIGTAEACALLAEQVAGSLIVFDEAQYFDPKIVPAWLEASERKVDILVGTPSRMQLKALNGEQYDLKKLEVMCSCQKRNATRVMYSEDLTYPTHLCDRCYHARMKDEEKKLLKLVQDSEPFPGERHTYQPFFGVDMSGWKLVRNDCPARLDIILDAVARTDLVQVKLSDPVKQPAFIDLGCCSGFFSHGMAEQGFRSHGVDVAKHFILWANQVAFLKGQAIDYKCQDLLDFLRTSDKTYDVVSTFATVQWVMDQRGYEAGIECFQRIFEKTGSICIVEMGYTTEDIYRLKIKDRPSEIDRQWVMNLMESSAKFSQIEFHPAGEGGIWRDIFVGFKKKPMARGRADALLKNVSTPFLQSKKIQIRELIKKVGSLLRRKTRPEKTEDFSLIPLKGMSQISKSEGYWDDGWVGPRFVTKLKPVQEFSKFRLEGWRPADSPSASVSISIEGQKFCSKEVEGGFFVIEGQAQGLNKDELNLEILTSYWTNSDNDLRDLSFVIKSLDFL